MAFETIRVYVDGAQTPAASGTADINGTATVAVSGLTEGTRTIEVTAQPAGGQESARRAAGSVSVAAFPGIDFSLLPLDRRAGDGLTSVWVPGVEGGIPHYTTVHSTLAWQSGDQRSRIQSALTAAGAAAAADGVGRVVSLGAGTWALSDSGQVCLYVPSRVVLRGAGLDGNGAMLTQLRYTRGAGASILVFGSVYWPEGNITGARNLSATAVKGATSVAVANTTGLAVGRMVVVDEISDGPDSGTGLPSATARGIYRYQDRHQLGGDGRGWWSNMNRPISQVMRIAAINGTTVTFTTPFHIDYRISQTAQLWHFGTTGVIEWSGVEDMRITGAGASTGIEGRNVQFNLARNCWARNIEADDSYGQTVAFVYAHHCTLRDSYLHDTNYYGNGGPGYAVDVRRSSTDNLIENNIIIRFNKVSNFRASGGGNVFAYNYTDDGGISWSPSWVETGIQASHMATPHHELFEGNYSWNADGEFTEGNACFVTFFRNHLSGVLANTPGWLTNGGPRRLGSAFFGHRWYSFIGNVLGVTGTSYTSWALDSNSSSGNAIWRMGVFDNDTYNDAVVRQTVLRSGNFDFKTNAQQWYGIGDTSQQRDTPRTLPASYYLAAKPAFFGANPWPWVTPESGTKYTTLPAKARYDSGLPNVVS